MEASGQNTLLVLEPKSFKPFKSKDEYLYAMKEDLAEWFTHLYRIDITVDNFFEVLETGVELCRHANEVRKFATERENMNGKVGAKSTFIRNIPMVEVQYKVGVKAQTFLARDNVSNFITWCRQLGVPEVLQFETDDLVLRKNERSVVLCLLEVARVGAKLGMLAPTIVKMEEEIEAELAGEPPPQIQTCDLKSLDEMVRELVGRCTCPAQFPMVKVGEGKYKIGESQTLIFVRILRNHVMVRVGGGWDTLEHYLDKHDPCRCNFTGHRGNVAASAQQFQVSKRQAIRRSSAPSSSIIADQLSKSPKKAVPQSTASKLTTNASGGVRNESPIPKPPRKLPAPHECLPEGHTPPRSHSPLPAKQGLCHGHLKVLPSVSTLQRPSSPVKRVAALAPSGPLPFSLKASSSLSMSAETLTDTSTSSLKSGKTGAINIDQISTMTLEEFKNLLNTNLSVPNGGFSQSSSDSPRSQMSSDSAHMQNVKPGSPVKKQAMEKGTAMKQNPASDYLLGTVDQGNGKPRLLTKSGVVQRRSPSPQNRRSKTPVPQKQLEFGSSLKPRSKTPGPCLLPRPATPANEEVPRPLIPCDTPKSSIPKSRPITPKMEKRKYFRSANRGESPAASDNSANGSNKLLNSKLRQPFTRSLTPGPRDLDTRPATPVATFNGLRRSSTPGPQGSRIGRSTDDLSSSGDYNNRGRFLQPGNKKIITKQYPQGMGMRSMSSQSLSLSVKEIPFGYDEKRRKDSSDCTKNTGYADRWRKAKEVGTAGRHKPKDNSLITISRNVSGGHSVIVKDAKAVTKMPARSEMLHAHYKDSLVADSKSKTPPPTNAASKRQRSRSMDRQTLSRQHGGSSTSSVEDNSDSPHVDRRPRRRSFDAHRQGAVGKAGARYDRRRQACAVTPNSVDEADYDLSSRSLDEIKNILRLPVNGITQIDADGLEAPPGDPELYEKMERLFQQYRQKELQRMVEASDNKDNDVDSIEGSESKENFADDSSLDSNANLKSSRSSLDNSSHASSQRCARSLSQEKNAMDDKTGVADLRNFPATNDLKKATLCKNTKVPQRSRIPAPAWSSKGLQRNRSSSASDVSGTHYSDEAALVGNVSDCQDRIINNELLDNLSDLSRRTSFSDDSSISTSDASLSQRSETPVPKMATPLTTGRSTLIRNHEKRTKRVNSKLMRAMTQESIDSKALDAGSYARSLSACVQDDDDETF